MKREILFRAQRVDNKEWVYGYYIKYSKIHHLGESDNIVCRDPYNGYCGREFYDVIPETVCQFTGLTDKNGTNIFEGDIVNIKSGEEYMYIREIDKNCVVKFSYGSFNPVDIDEIHYDFGNIDEFEVIGNIFDSPELLK